MGPDLQTPGTPLRCPACSASVRPGAPWCTQCYAELRSGPAAPASPALPAASSAAPSLSSAEPTAPSAEPTLSPAPPGSPALPAAPAAGDTASWPCSACGTANALSRDSCSACGAGFLAALRAAEEPLLVLPGVGDVGALSRAQRLGLAAGVVLLVVLLTALLGFLLS